MANLWLLILLMNLLLLGPALTGTAAYAASSIAFVSSTPALSACRPVAASSTRGEALPSRVEEEDFFLRPLLWTWAEASERFELVAYFDMLRQSIFRGETGEVEGGGGELDDEEEDWVVGKERVR